MSALQAPEPVEGYFTGDAFPDLAFPATGFGEPWNGWATPGHSEATGRAIIAAYNNGGPMDLPSAAEVRTADGQGAAIIGYGPDGIPADVLAAVAAMTLAEVDSLSDFVTSSDGRDFDVWPLTAIGWGAYCWYRVEGPAVLA